MSTTSFSLSLSLELSKSPKGKKLTQIIIPQLRSDSDFLSSIELVVVDQMDVMLQQNWDHLNVRFTLTLLPSLHSESGTDEDREEGIQFVMERLNKIPEEDHGCDFSRVKPWYLDGKYVFFHFSPPPP